MKSGKEASGIAGVTQGSLQKSPPPDPPSLAGCWFDFPLLALEPHHSEILCKWISCIVAQTIARQLFSKVQDIDLISALPHEAPQTFNGVGRLNVSMHRLGKGVKRQEGLFVLRQASYRFWIAFTVSDW